MSALEDAIEAAWKAIPDDPEVEHMEIAARVVDAVLPIIEADVESHNRCHCTSCIVSEECLAEGCQFDRSMAEVRERIAQEIEARRDEIEPGPKDFGSGVRAGLHEAARIARGGTR